MKMKPTKEQLKDPKWWDENAPEGAEALIAELWRKWIDGVEMEFSEGLGKWMESADQWSLDDHVKRHREPIPTRPEPEWKPKVGGVCLARVYDDVWSEVELLKLCNNGAWVCYEDTPSGSEVFFSKDIKPLPKTPREQFVEKAAKQFDYRVDDLAALYDLAMEFK